MPGFDKERLTIALIENVKTDIARSFSDDQLAYTLVNDLLHHFCWKLHNKEVEKEMMNESQQVRSKHNHSWNSKNGN